MNFKIKLDSLISYNFLPFSSPHIFPEINLTLSLWIKHLACLYLGILPGVEFIKGQICQYQIFIQNIHFLINSNYILVIVIINSFIKLYHLEIHN